MIEPLESGSPKILAFKLSGKLHDTDYKTFVPVVDTAVTGEGKISLLAHFEDFHGWDLHAAWDDFKFGLAHYSDFERFAIVGDQKWEEWMARFGKLFTRAAVKYFDVTELDAAWAWVREAAG